ncbi:MAG: manganese efflux pump [Clostridia bacterium]|nr:manganese efflux pump [Clostridia bacterium]
MDFNFFMSAALLGLGLAMDACAVSMANGLKYPCIKLGKVILIAAFFALFQGIMPLIGWVCVHTVVEKFEAFGKIVPYIALALLGFIGGKMLYEGLTHKDCDAQDECGCAKPLTFWALIVQAVATSIDALSVGFTIAEYNLTQALVAVAVIALVTFATCFVAVFLGKKFGTKLGNKAEILGGLILIGIGIEIFISGVFF